MVSQLTLFSWGTGVIGVLLLPSEVFPGHCNVAKWLVIIIVTASGFNVLAHGHRLSLCFTMHQNHYFIHCMAETI